MKQELMLIGFISLFITAFQGPITHICIPRHSTKILLPCKKNVEEDFSIERLAPKVGHCERKGMEPFLSIEGMHQLDIFVFVLAITHIILSISTMFLGSIKIHFWKHWEDEFKNPPKTPQKFEKKKYIHVIHHSFIKMHSPYTMSPIRGWLISFFKQFWGSVKRSDYRTIRLGFIKTFFNGTQHYNFHKYVIRTLEEDFKKVVGIRFWHWIFVIVFLLLNNHGWNMYFYVSFIPLILLLALGAKIQHIMIQLAQEFVQKNTVWTSPEIEIRPSNEHFWFNQPGLLLHLIQFILFQNAFELAFFFWLLITYGFRSCIMGKVQYVIPKLVIGCSITQPPTFSMTNL
ncbi:hypothetical protein SUGI_0097520 [Cryptomeria japonica]|nr:hypothetical protein SUGI_0097520 [Cryptomeria japonica]